MRQAGQYSQPATHCLLSSHSKINRVSKKAARVSVTCVSDELTSSASWRRSNAALSPSSWSRSSKRICACLASALASASALAAASSLLSSSCCCCLRYSLSSSALHHAAVSHLAYGISGTIISLSQALGTWPLEYNIQSCYYHKL